MKYDRQFRLTVPLGNGFIVDAQDQERMLSVAKMCRLTGVTRKTLYYYDKIGLLKPVERRGSQGSKIYDEDALHVLLYIRECQKAGLHLCEIRQLLEEDAEGKIKILHQVILRLRDEQNLLLQQQKQACTLLRELEQAGVEKDVL